MLLHHHHDERGDDVEGRNQYNQNEDDKHRDLLQLQGGEEVSVHLHPVLRPERKSHLLADLLSDFFHFIDIVGFDLNPCHTGSHAEKLLGTFERDIGHGVIVLIHSRIKNTHETKTLHLGHHSHRCHGAERGDHLDHIVERDAGMLGQFYSEVDPC